MRESYEKLKKDINLVEKQNLEDMTYKNAIVVLHTKILPAEELINEIKEKNLFSKNEVTNFGKKILIMKTNYQNIINKKEEEHSQLEAFKINQQELGKKKEQEISEIQKRYRKNVRRRKNQKEKRRRTQKKERTRTGTFRKLLSSF